MKKVSIVIITIFSLFLFSSCAPKKPQDVAEAFANAFHHMEFNKAKSFATAASAKQLDMIKQIALGVPNEEKEKAKKIIIVMGQGKESGDKATYYYTPSDTEIPQKINLVKQNGKWLVEWNKEDSIPKDKDKVELEMGNTPQNEPGVELKVGK